MTATPRTITDQFALIASHYARYRPGYPSEVVAELANRFGLDGTGRIVDIGCGTGQIAIPIAPLAAQTVAIDPVPVMLLHGARAAEKAGVGHRIRWVHGTAADLPRLDLGTFTLAVAASSIHWIDTPRMLADLEPMIEPAGGVAIITSARPDTYPRPGWQLAADQVRHRWTRPDPRRGRGAGASGAGIADALRASAFNAVTCRTWETELIRDLDAAVGLQYTYAATAPAVLGADQIAYETDLRRALTEACPDGILADRRRTEAWMATRP